jgi:hypothetical protein
MKADTAYGWAQRCYRRSRPRIIMLLFITG